MDFNQSSSNPRPQVGKVRSSSLSELRGWPAPSVWVKSFQKIWINVWVLGIYIQYIYIHIMFLYVYVIICSCLSKCFRNYHFHSFPMISSSLKMCCLPFHIHITYTWFMLFLFASTPTKTFNKSHPETLPARCLRRCFFGLRKSSTSSMGGKFSATFTAPLSPR